jgi:hypothetical protein
MSRFRDRLQVGSQDQLLQNLEKIASELDFVGLILHNRTKNRHECRMYSRIAISTSEQICHLHKYIDGPIEITANVVRTTFEINVVLRYLLQFPGYGSSFSAQAGTDEISLYKAIRDMAHEETPQEHLDEINNQIEHIRGILTRHNLPLKPDRLSTAQLAKAIGLEKEYQTMYAIYSKYVHASAWFVLRPRDHIDQPMYRLPMQTHSQIYALDTLSRLQKI